MARSVEDRMSFMEHLGELRVRIVRALYALLVGSVPGLYFSQQIVDWLARPATKPNYSLVFTPRRAPASRRPPRRSTARGRDRKSTRLHSSPVPTSYPVVWLNRT